MDDSIYYDSWKEERDVLLEYNQVTLDDVIILASRIKRSTWYSFT